MAAKKKSAKKISSKQPSGANVRSPAPAVQRATKGGTSKGKASGQTKSNVARASSKKTSSEKTASKREAAESTTKKKLKKVAAQVKRAADKAVRQAKTTAGKTVSHAKQAVKKAASRAKKSADKTVDRVSAVRSKAVKSKSAKSTESNGEATRSAGVAEGARAPEFALSDQSGKSVSSETLAGKPYVLYFYPKDDTPGCTREACSFRDNLPNFNKAKVAIFGVSPDSTTSHEKFSKKYGLPFTLLSDPDKTLARAYGVWVKKKNYGREYMGIERSTFLVDGQGQVRKAWRSVKVDGHVDRVLEQARKL